MPTEPPQINQAKQQREGSERSLNQILKETYKWILCPLEDIVQGKPKLVWESVPVPANGQNLSADIENKFNDESLQRSVKENCSVLKFISAEFEE